MPLRLLLWWDTEDFINPESDDALLMLLEEHRKRRAPAVFKMVGEKSRVLDERGRRDIVALLSEPLFDIGYHTDFHSVHPTIAEYVEHCTWEEGVAEILARETDGLEITRRLFDKPVLCYGQPGASYTPQAYAAMRVWDIPCYLDGSVYLGLPDRPSYLLGRLNIGWLGKASGSFPARDGEAALESAKARLAPLIASPPAGRLISHGGHPNEWSLADWWDTVNFRDGANPMREDWRPAPLHAPEYVKRMLALFGEYLDWLVEQGIELVGLEETFRRYGPGDFVLDSHSARAAAEAWATGEIGYYLDDGRGKSMSAAQVLYGLAVLLAEGKSALAVPEVDPPTREPVRAAQPAPLTVAGVEEAARRLVAHVRACNALPADVRVGTGQVSLADLAVAVAQAFLKRPLAAGAVRFIPGEMVRVYGRDVGPWGIHHPGFTGENLARLTRLAAWSFKPALLVE